MCSNRITKSLIAEKTATIYNCEGDKAEEAIWFLIKGRQHGSAKCEKALLDIVCSDDMETIKKVARELLFVALDGHKFCWAQDLLFCLFPGKIIEGTQSNYADVAISSFTTLIYLSRMSNPLASMAILQMARKYTLMAKTTDWSEK